MDESNMSSLSEHIPSDPYNVKEDHYVKIALKSVGEYNTIPSKVAAEFFSVSNIKRIQKKIKKEIYERTYGKFKLTEDQKVLSLLIAMMSVYLLNTKDLDDHIVSQVKILNEQTVQDVVPGMITNIKQYYGYLEDITNPVNVLPDPINVNRAGRRTTKGPAQVYDI
jgi:hypothetical protein